MSPPRRTGDAAPMRRFFLERTPEQGDPVLEPEELEHALKVLRLKPGDGLWGLDGRGSAWPLRVRGTSSAPRGLELEATGEAQRELLAGADRAPLPWIEVWAPLPRGARAGAMLERLVQLGAAAYVPLECAHASAQAREAGPARLAKLARTAREACKQSGRLWLPTLGPTAGIDQLCRRARQGAVGLGWPQATQRFADWAAQLDPRGVGSRERPIVLAVGPEGGFSDEERAALTASGVRELSLAPAVLRIETAAEAALAVVVQTLWRR